MTYLAIPISSPTFENDCPGWAALKRMVTDKEMALGNIEDWLGITKQQIDYWIQKGVLSVKDQTPTKWRRFSILDALLLAITVKFKSKGIEVSNMYHIRKEIPFHPEWTKAFVYIVSGHEVFLYSDFKGTTGIICIDHEDQEGDELVFKFNLSKESDFVALISLKKICDAMAQKHDWPHFRVNILPDGSYKFIINGIPLALESLHVDDQLTSVGIKGGII